MTDYIGNILSQMSSAFNQTTQSEEVSITADKTLKWRGLHNNQYASKDGRLISRRSKRIKNELIDGSDEYVPGGSDSISGDIDDEEKINDNNIDDSKLVNAASTPYAALPIETILSVENQDIPQISSQEKDENASNTVTSDKKNITIDKVNLDDKKTTKMKINKCIDKSDRNLRSKNFDVFSLTSLNVSTTTTTTSMATTSQYVNNMIITTTIIASKSTDNTISDDVLNNSETNKIRKNTRSRVQSTAIKVENYLPSSSTGTDDKSCEIKEESTVISKKRGRKKITNDETQSQTSQMESLDVSNGCVIKSEIEEYVADASVAQPQPLEISTENIKESVSDTDITIPVVDESATIPETKTIEKTIKKRGRKPKIQITAIVKKSSRLARDAGESILASAIARREKINENLTATPTSRLSRRIKPTAKILANEELRQGFELHNNARISLTSERNMENERFLEQNKTKEVPVNMKASANGFLASDRNTARTQNNNHNISNTNINSHKHNAVHTKNALPKSHNTTIGITRTLARNLSVANIYTNVEHLDSEKFLNEIKTSGKVNLNGSSGSGGTADDNKKLKKKQQKRLAKLKEKHFHQLGLRKTNISSDSDTDTDGNDDFVPTKKINVGKPGVTLRIRNDAMVKQHKQQSQPSQQQNQNRHKNQSMRITIAPGTSDNSNAVRNCNKLKRSDYFVKYYQPKKQKTSDNSMTKHDTAIPLSKLICLCQEKTQYYVNKSMETSYCSGMDHIGKKKIGCNVELKGEILNLARSSVRTSYMILCDSHLNRLKAHNCCAGCGVFCTQGYFILCPKKHFFHRDCADKFILNTPYNSNNMNSNKCPQLVLKCPHCGVDVPLTTNTLLRMKCNRVPVFSPYQRNLIRTARMGINYNKTNYNNFMLNIEKLIPDSIFHILNIANEKLMAQQKYTAKDLFYAIYSNKDIDKIAEIVVSGFDLLTPFKEFHNGTCLHLASNFGNITMIYLILCRTSCIDFLNLFDRELRTAVMCAVVGEKNDILKLLIQCGADVTLKGPDGMTSLHLAAKIGNYMGAQIILDHYRQNASISNLDYFINTIDDGHWTALVWAAENGHTDIVNLLITLGADVNICDLENNTVLHWAALSGRLETFYPLLSKNTNCNLQNINGDTALHIACRQSNSRICVLLLANGGNLDIVNLADETPFDCVADKNNNCATVIKANIEFRKLGKFPKTLILCGDISNGREIYPIQMISNLKSNNESSSVDEKLLPDFKYITKNIIFSSVTHIDQRISQMRICSCADNCTSGSCQCAAISIKNWYTFDGRINENYNFADPPSIFECSEVCSCNKMTCKNRVVQKGIKYPMQVFECEEKDKGWGVRSLAKIPRGGFVSEYTGEILTSIEAHRRTDDSYFFDLGASEYCIDANFYGNISRFFNHSCEPNLVPVRVFYDHHDLRFPKIAFFAYREIDIDDEITFDYGDSFWNIKHKNMSCSCKTEKCRFTKATCHSE